jgi:ethanolamine ammonia-lyase large subunit
MTWVATTGGERFRFGSMRELMAKANEHKSGDALADLAATSERERIAAKRALSDVSLGELLDEPVLEDAVTDAILERVDRPRFDRLLRSLTVGELREHVLGTTFAARWTEEGLHALTTPEIAAAVTKLMSDLDLMIAAAPLRIVTRCRNTIGEPGVFASRIQPNHPVDDERGIALSIIDGLLLGSGDALIGVNPATESVESVHRVLRLLDDIIDGLELPTQGCVLAHVTTQLEALRTGAPIDLVFQSVAGTEATNAAFGISLALLQEAQEAVREQHRARPDHYIGDQVMYFETGQGSALSTGAHHDIDQLTCEARAQAVARLYDPFLVNSVVGFIGPEYLADARQIARAGLEDHFMGKLMGLPMGCDVCYTNHADADQNSNDDLLVLLASAGCNFVMGVPGGDDVMLNYQSTSYHDVASIRRLLGLRPAPEFDQWLAAKGITHDGMPLRAEGSARSFETLRSLLSPLALPVVGERA